ncbi:MAG TPA: MraY family glycosyltransferase [Verrucomicrobiae bacterium]
MNNFKTYLAVLVMSALASFFLTPLARKLAFKWGAIDKPDPRKVHKEPMPRLGGLAVFGGFCAPWLAFYLLDNRVTVTFQNYEKLFLALMIAASLMLLLGVADDVKGLNAKQKFSFQTMTALALYFGGYQITLLSNPFGGSIALGWLALPVSVLWIVGVTNAINLLDGIDGLATGVTVCIALSLAVINIMNDNIMVALLTLCLAGSCLGFLPHNFSPAKIFLGDSGSLFIGLVLSGIGIISLFKVTTAAIVIVPVMLFGIPLFDTTAVFFGRLMRGDPLFKADKTHLHHRLLHMGMDHRQASLLLYAVSAALGGVAIYVNVYHSPRTVLIASALVALLAIYVLFTLRDLDKPKDKS